MRIVRYTLDIVQYQELQVLWPGRILSVGACPPYEPDSSPRPGAEIPLDDPRRYRVDMWAFDNDANRRGRPAPILGVWIIGTGNPIPQPMFDADALFHGTVDHRPHGGAWHVFSAVVGEAMTNEDVAPERYSSVDEMVERIKAKHARGER